MMVMMAMVTVMTMTHTCPRPSNTTKSASQPTHKDPFFPSNPSSRAAAALAQDAAAGSGSPVAAAYRLTHASIVAMLPTCVILSHFVID
jgi:hypothetical protein